MCNNSVCFCLGNGVHLNQENEAVVIPVYHKILDLNSSTMQKKGGWVKVEKIVFQREWSAYAHVAA